MSDHTAPSSTGEVLTQPVRVSRRLPAASATGVGSMPGTSARAAMQLVLDELPQLPHLPELAARGPGGEMTGRMLGLMPDFGAEWGPTGWALTDHSGRANRRAASWLDEDLDVAEELADRYDGVFKVQLCGPWTLAATVELRSGRKALADTGATRDLHQAHAEAVAAHLSEVSRRLPSASVVVQLDEPALPHILGGGVPTPSGLTHLAAVDRQVVEAALRRLTSLGNVGVHCCAASPPLHVITAAGAAFVSVDATLLTQADDDAVGETLEAGVDLFLGAVGTSGPLPSADAAADPLREMWARLGQPPETLASVVVTPACGLAGSSTQDVAAVLGRCSEVARLLADEPERRHG